MRPQMCGAERGVVYVYEIEAAALSKALALGFTHAIGEPRARLRPVPCAS